MKITKTDLKQIIKEEYNRLVSEVGPRYGDVGSRGYMDWAEAQREKQQAAAAERAALRATPESTPIKQALEKAHDRIMRRDSVTWEGEGLTQLRQKFWDLNDFLNIEKDKPNPKIPTEFLSAIKQYGEKDPETKKYVEDNEYINVINNMFQELRSSKKTR